MKKLKITFLLIAIIFANNITNAQFQVWEQDSMNLYTIAESPVTHELFGVDDIQVYKFNYSTNNWDIIFNFTTNYFGKILFNADGIMYFTIQDMQNTLLYYYNDTTSIVNISNIDISNMADIYFFDSYNNLWGNNMSSMVFYIDSSGSSNSPTIFSSVSASYETFKADNSGHVWFYNNPGGVKSTNSLGQGIFKYDIASDTITDSIAIPANAGPHLSLFLSPNDTLYFKYHDDNTNNDVLAKYKGNNIIDTINNIASLIDPLFFDNTIITKTEDIWIPADSSLYCLRPDNTILQFNHSPSGAALLYPRNFYGNGRYLYVNDDNLGFYKIDLSTNIFVMVNYNGSSLTDADVELKIFSNTINSVAGPDSIIGGMMYNNGYFNFSLMVQDSIYLKAFLTAGSSYTDILLNSYYSQNDTAYTWDNATILHYNSGYSDTLILNMYELPQITTQSGLAAGNVSYGTPGTKAAGEPVPGAEIIIEQEPTDDPVAMSVTDSNGDYNINLPDNINFKMTVDIPGIPQIQTYNLSYVSGNNQFTNLNFYVDTTGIYTDTTVGAKEINTNNFNLSIYPVPSNNAFVNIKYTVKNNNSTVNYKIIDINGKVVYSQQLQNKDKGTYYIKTDNLNNGIYFVQFNVNNDFIAKKIIISK